MKKRKLGYNELQSEEFIKIFNKMKNDKKLNFSLIVNGLDYNFECMYFYQVKYQQTKKILQVFLLIN